MQDEAGEFRAITDNLIKYFANDLRKELSIIGEFLFLWYVFLLSTIIHHHNYIEGDMRNWRKRCFDMIIQPKRGTRNVNESFYEGETRKIEMLNEIFGDVELSRAEMQTLVWLAGWEESTIKNVVSAILKVTSK